MATKAKSSTTRSKDCGCNQKKCGCSKKAESSNEIGSGRLSKTSRTCSSKRTKSTKSCS